MNNLWSDQEASLWPGAVGQRVYSSRLLGRDKSLVLHGGGNTSVKASVRDVFGEETEILYVKGSGWDLERIEAAGFAPVQLAHLKQLAQLPELADPVMVNELVTHTVQAGAPVPSIEAILHAILPYTYVDHTHADAIVAITNTADGEARIRDLYGDEVVVIPYVMPGFDLARLCGRLFARQAGPQTIGMVLMNHGIFSFGATAQQSYERMIDLVGRAEAYLQRHHAWQVVCPESPPVAVDRVTIADLRRQISDVAGFPMIMARHSDADSLAFARRLDVAVVAQQGPATPDHVIRTKRLPMIGRDVAAYAAAYRNYSAAHEPLAKERKTMLDAAPRVVLDPDLGLCALGRSAKEAAIVADIYHHTMEIISRSERLGGYRALSAQQIFEVEYWDLEQAKLRKSGKLPPLSGEVALVTGAASGIGKACVASLLARGAAVVGLDINPSVVSLHQRPDYLGLVCDVTAEQQLQQALSATTDAFGGLDMLILNAGIFPGGCRIENTRMEEWHQVMQINLHANLLLMRETYPLLKLAPRHGRVVIIGSKNVPAPGPGAASYSASKAALNQLARVAALEWGGEGIRINSLHPNAVFDTAIWSEQVLQSRASHYGLTVDTYKKNNVLKVEVTSHDVAELAAEMCGPLFAKTTGAQLAVDGGNDRVI
ncbi:MAG: bifunctional aldolase/short-chain dehydrogenase [Magnetococcales bacterium]|nr:bifunctional aldolase/short-chain dehydrogenase [Magnetococcales bacterium]